MDVPLEEPPKFSLTSVEDYAPLIGGEAADRILMKAERLRDFHVSTSTPPITAAALRSCSPR